MEALLQSLAAKYGFDVAKKLLGLDKQQGNPKYTFGMPLTNNKVSFNPMKTIANQAFKSAIKSGGGSGIFAKGIPLLAASLGLGYMRNPLREGSMNYNPELQGQIDYLSGMDGMVGKDPNSYALKYGPESVLRGKNVVSLFGINDYEKNLQKYINEKEAIKAKGYNTIGIGPLKTKTSDWSENQQNLLDKAYRELEDLTTDEFDRVDEFMSAPTSTQTGPTYKGMSSIGSGGSGGDKRDDNKSSNNQSSGSKSSRSKDTSKGGQGTASYGRNFHARRGGIASL